MAHNLLLFDKWNEECTCTLYKYAIDIKFENLFCIYRNHCMSLIWCDIKVELDQSIDVV